MSDATMWQGILTETYIDKVSSPGSTLLMSTSEVGNAHPDPNSAWRDAEEMLEKHQKRKSSIVQISICPAGYLKEMSEDGGTITRTLN